MNAAEAKRETESLAKRYPKKGIDATIPEGIREMLVDREKSKLTPASKYAKGGSVKGGGCEQRGLRKCKVM